MAEYQSIPVSAARDIADRYSKSIVLILAHDPTYGKLHATSYGVSPADKQHAAAGVDLCVKALGSDPGRRHMFEDFRFVDQAKRAQAIERLTRACRAADHALGSILTVRDGMSDEALGDVRKAIQEALASSGHDLDI